MKTEEIIQKLVAVCNALDRVYVCGEQNIDNISGSIKILRNITENLKVELSKSVQTQKGTE